MSERGSFVTEYIYCSKCFEAAKSVLLGKEKYLCSVVIPTWSPGPAENQELPIIAGKCGGLYLGEEVNTFEFEYRDQLEPLLCHPLDIAVLCEYREHRTILTFEPRTEKP